MICTKMERDKLLKILRMLSSDQDGERAAAAAKANELAVKLGGWNAVVPDVNEDVDVVMRLDKLRLYIAKESHPSLDRLIEYLRKGHAIDGGYLQKLKTVLQSCEASAAMAA